MTPNFNSNAIYAKPHRRSLEKMFFKSLKLGRFDTIKLLLDNGFNMSSCHRKKILKSKIECNLCKKSHFEVAHFYFCCNEPRQKYIDLTYLHAVGKGDFNLVKFLEKRRTKLRINLPEPLKYLIRSGNICLIKKIIEKNSKKINFNIMANEACLSGQAELVKYFFSYMQINNYDHFLIDACLSGNLELVKYLVSCGASICSCRQMPLKNACLSGNQKLVKFLLENGADVTLESQEDEENCAFNNACRSGNYDLVKFFVKKNLYYDFKNQHTLYIACISKNKAIVKFLLSLGFSLSENAENCLMYATINHDFKLINYFSRNGASLLKYGNKAFVKACGSGDEYMVDYFLKNGFDPSLSEGKGLKAAILHGNFKIAEKLMPFYTLSEDEKIYLYEQACMCEELERIIFLEKHYGDIKITSMALSLACWLGSIDTIKHLLERGADVNADNGAGILSAFDRDDALKVIKFFVENNSKYFLNKNTLDRCIEKIIQKELSDVFKYLVKTYQLKELINEKNFYYFLSHYSVDSVIFMLLNNVKITKNHHAIIRRLVKSKKTKPLKKIFAKYPSLASLELLNYGFNLACDAGNLNLAKLFYFLGANVDPNNQHALINACLNNRINIVNFILKCKVDLCSNSNRIINAAVQGGNLKIIKKLMHNGLNSLMSKAMILYVSYKSKQDREYIVQYILNNEIHTRINLKNSTVISSKSAITNFQKASDMLDKGSLVQTCINCFDDEKFIIYLTNQRLKLQNNELDN